MLLIFRRTHVAEPELNMLWLTPSTTAFNRRTGNMRSAGSAWAKLHGAPCQILSEVLHVVLVWRGYATVLSAATLQCHMIRHWTRSACLEGARTAGVIAAVVLRDAGVAFGAATSPGAVSSCVDEACHHTGRAAYQPTQQAHRAVSCTSKV